MQIWSFPFFFLMRTAPDDRGLFDSPMMPLSGGCRKWSWSSWYIYGGMYLCLCLKVTVVTTPILCLIADVHLMSKSPLVKISLYCSSTLSCCSCIRSSSSLNYPNKCFFPLSSIPTLAQSFTIACCPSFDWLASNGYSLGSIGSTCLISHKRECGCMCIGI